MPLTTYVGPLWLDVLVKYSMSAINGTRLRYDGDLLRRLNFNYCPSSRYRLDSSRQLTNLIHVTQLGLRKALNTLKSRALSSYTVSTMRKQAVGPSFPKIPTEVL